MESLDDLMRRTLVYVPDNSGYWSEEQENVYHWRTGGPNQTMCGLSGEHFNLAPVGEASLVIPECRKCREVINQLEKGWS